MNVFLSWSGTRSGALATSLRKLLPNCIQALTPFMSSTDIEPGANWFVEIGSALDEAEGMGIFVLTPENVASPWINFEAGYIAARGHQARVCCLLLDLKPEGVPFPLQAFNQVIASADGARKLVTMLNGRLDSPLSNEQLEFALAQFLSSFGEAVEAALATEFAAKHDAPPNVPDQLDQLIASINRIERGVAAQSTLLQTMHYRNASNTALGYALNGMVPPAQNLGLSSDATGLLPPSVGGLLGTPAVVSRSSMNELNALLSEAEASLSGPIEVSTPQLESLEGRLTAYIARHPGALINSAILAGLRERVRADLVKRGA